MSDELSFVQAHWWQALLGIAAIGGAVAAFGAWFWPKTQEKQPITIGGPLATTPPPQPAQNTAPAPRQPLGVGFVDRPALIARILDACQHQYGAAVVSSLQGMGGVGKTELAREVGRILERQSPKPPGASRVALVNLRGWDSGQPMGEEEALRELCPQLDPSTDPTLPLPNLRAHWKAVTGQGWPAVILDNLRDPALLEPLRPTNGVTILTSREQVVQAGITPIEVGTMEPAEAVALALNTHPGLSRDDAAALAATVGYLPLAIPLAAAYLARSGEPVTELQRRIGETAGGKDHLQNLFERVVGLSIADLDEEQRAQWLALSLPPGDFGLWTVQALWQDGDPRPALGGLANRHLILPVGEGRWRLHDLLRHYGRTMLAATPEAEQDLWRQLGPAAVERLEEINARFRSGGEEMVPALAELDAELPLLLDVQEWAARRFEKDATAAEVASRLPHPLCIDFRLSPSERLNWLQTALPAAEHRGEKAEIAAAAGNLGLVHRHRGEWEEALSMHHKSLAIAEELGDRAGVARNSGNLGLVHQERGEWEEALSMHHKSLAIAEELGNRAYAASQYGNLGLVHRERGELEEALSMHRKSLAIAVELGNRAYAASQYGNLGLVHRERGELEEALAMHRKSLAIAEELGNRAGMARQYGNLGLVHQQRRETEEAEAALRQSTEIFEDLGDRAGIARTFYNLGGVLKDQGDWEGAAEHFRRSLALAEELGMPDADQDRKALAEVEAHLAGGGSAT